MGKLANFVLLFIAFISFGCSMKITSFNVPHTVYEGSDVKISCFYQTEDSKLHSVKWYKDQKEFYNYMPNNFPHTKIFVTAGVSVDLMNSEKGVVTLRNVDVTYSGKYLCEANEVGPYYHTKREDGFMTVVALPKEDPRIQLGRYTYKTGEHVTANCTTDKAKPKLKLTWYINDVQAPSRSVVESVPQVDLHGRSHSLSTIKFVVKEEHFEAEKLKLKCSASVDKYYKRSDSDILNNYEKYSNVVIKKKRIEVTDSSLVSARINSSSKSDAETFKMFLVMTLLIFL